MTNVFFSHIPLFGTLSWWKTLHQSDHFVVLSRQGIRPDSYQYKDLEIPLRYSSRDYEDVRVDNMLSSWADRLWQHIYDTYHRSRNFVGLEQSLRTILCGQYYIYLLTFDLAICDWIAQQLSVNTHQCSQSDLPYTFDDFTLRLLTMARYFGADEVHFPESYRSEIRKILFRWHKLKVRFVKPGREQILDVVFEHPNLAEALQ